MKKKKEFQKGGREIAEKTVRKTRATIFFFGSFRGSWGHTYYTSN